MPRITLKNNSQRSFVVKGGDYLKPNETIEIEETEGLRLISMYQGELEAVGKVKVKANLTVDTSKVQEKIEELKSQDEVTEQDIEDAVNSVEVAVEVVEEEVKDEVTENTEVEADEVEVTDSPDETTVEEVEEVKEPKKRGRKPKKAE